MEKLNKLSDKQIEKNRIKIIKALRGGKYTQIMDCVKSRLGHCFIGLAYEELGMMKGLIHTGSREDIARMLGIEDLEYLEDTSRRVDMLVSMNDAGQSFNTIANSLINTEGFPNVKLEDI